MKHPIALVLLSVIFSISSARAGALPSDYNLPYVELYRTQKGDLQRATYRAKAGGVAERIIEHCMNERFMNERPDSWQLLKVEVLNLEEVKNYAAGKRLAARMEAAADQADEDAAAQRRWQANQNYLDREAYKQPKQYVLRDANGNVLRSVEVK